MNGRGCGAGSRRTPTAAALHHQLGAAARAWDADARDPGSLYRGGRLASALEWAAGHAGELDATERAFLDAGRRASGRAQRRLRAGLAGMGALLGLAVVAGVIALDQRDRARAQADAAAAQRLGAQALATDEIDRSLLLARQGVALEDSVQTRGNLLGALLKSPAAIGVLPIGGRVTGLALSPDERRLTVRDTEGNLVLFDTATRREAEQSRVIAWRRLSLEPWNSTRSGSRLALGGRSRSSSTRGHGSKSSARTRRPRPSTCASRPTGRRCSPRWRDRSGESPSSASTPARACRWEPAHVL